jgi:hypothetical protein
MPNWLRAIETRTRRKMEVVEDCGTNDITGPRTADEKGTKTYSTLSAKVGHDEVESYGS